MVIWTIFDETSPSKNLALQTTKPKEAGIGANKSLFSSHLLWGYAYKYKIHRPRSTKPTMPPLQAHRNPKTLFLILSFDQVCMGLSKDSVLSWPPNLHYMEGNHVKRRSPLGYRASSNLDVCLHGRAWLFVEKTWWSLNYEKEPSWTFSWYVSTQICISLYLKIRRQVQNIQRQIMH